MAVVLVTGGSAGIGRATVQRLAAGGHRVFAASRRPERSPLPDGVTPLVLDVGDPAAAAPCIDAVVDAAGRIDALVNNAGTGAIGALEETGDDEAARIFEVNVFGPMRLARAAIPHMREQRGGRIVNVTSMNDVLPAPFAGWYSASKAALASASRVLDAEVHRFGIYVSVVAPGLFRSEMSDQLTTMEVPAGSLYATALTAIREQNIERVGTSAGDPSEVADAIASCIDAPSPPGRVIVGFDAPSMAKLVHDASDDDFTAMLRAFVAGLG